MEKAAPDLSLAMVLSDHLGTQSKSLLHPKSQFSPGESHAERCVNLNLFLESEEELTHKEVRHTGRPQCHWGKARGFAALSRWVTSTSYLTSPSLHVFAKKRRKVTGNSKGNCEE